MKYIKENKELLLKYLLVIITNIIISIMCNFYFKNTEYRYLIMLGLAVIIDFIIYYYKGTKVFNTYLDFITNFIIGLILIIFCKYQLDYASICFSLIFANNIIFMRSRYSDKFFKRSLQYLLILIFSIISLFINTLIFVLIK